MSLSLLLPVLLAGASAPASSDDFAYPERIGRCLIVAEGRSYTLNPCRYRFHHSRLGGHSLSFGQRRPRNYYVRFGYIEFGNDASRSAGDGIWNGPDIRNLHADHETGRLRRHGNCWSNRTARFCFSPAPAER